MSNQVQFEFTLLYLSSKKRAKITVKILKYTIEELDKRIQEDASDKLIQCIGVEVKNKLDLPHTPSFFFNSMGQRLSESKELLAQLDTTEEVTIFC